MKMGEIIRAVRPRKREDYRATVVRQERLIADKALEIARLRRKLLLIDDFTEKALA